MCRQTRQAAAAHAVTAGKRRGMVRSMDRRTLSIYRQIKELAIDNSLQFGSYRLEHREPITGRRFYALYRRSKLIGVEHYQDYPVSLERVQRGLALLLAGLGWQPARLSVHWCKYPRDKPAHRLPRLLPPPNAGKTPQQGHRRDLATTPG